LSIVASHIATFERTSSRNEITCLDERQCHSKQQHSWQKGTQEGAEAELAKEKLEMCSKHQPFDIEEKNAAEIRRGTEQEISTSEESLVLPDT